MARIFSNPHMARAMDAEEEYRNKAKREEHKPEAEPAMHGKHPEIAVIEIHPHGDGTHHAVIRSHSGETRESDHPSLHHAAKHIAEALGEPEVMPSEPAAGIERNALGAGKMSPAAALGMGAV